MFVSHRASARNLARPADLLIRRLNALTDLSESEIRQIRAAAASTETTRAGRDLAADRRAARHARFVVSGWACRRRILADGRRQIFGFALPGDLLDASASGSANVGFAALTAVETVDAEGLRQAADDHPGLAKALAALGEQQDRLLLDHVVRLGRMNALERLCHMLLELRERLAVVGLADERRLSLPLTQEMMADTLGLSIVHVNRTLQQLRQERMIELRAGVAHLIDVERMVDVCDYHAYAARPSAPAHARVVHADSVSPMV